MPRPRVVGSFPFYFIRTYPSPRRRLVVLGLLAMSSVSLVGAAVTNYGGIPQTQRTQSAATVTARVTDQQLETQYSRFTVTGYITHLSLRTPRGDARLDLDVKAQLPADDRILVKQDPQDPAYVELPGYPQNSARRALGLLLFVPALVVLGIWFSRRERRLIGGGEPVRRHAVIATVLILAIVFPASSLVSGGPESYPPDLVVPGPR